MSKLVEFIESYIKTDHDDDYKWNDNHGELVRCENCMYYDKKVVLDDFPGKYFCVKMGVIMKPDGFCSEGDKDESRNEDQT